MKQTNTIPVVDRPGLNSNHTFFVDGEDQNLRDALRYLDNIAEFSDIDFPFPRRKYNELKEWIYGFNWAYERIPKNQKI